MSTQDFLVIWLLCTVVIMGCRVIPIFALRGRELPAGVVEALGYIPPAAFAALVTNDLVSSSMFDAGIWAGLMPIVAAIVVMVIAWRTKSMLWCCVCGVVAYVLLGLI